MKKNQVYKSGFIKGDALRDAPIVRTINGAREHVFDDGTPQVVVSFRDDDRDLGLNAGNFDAIVEISGQDDTDNWGGTQIELYFDPNVTYMGKRTGGVRIRKPTGAAKAPAKGPPPDDDAGPPPDETEDAGALAAQAKRATSKLEAWAVWSKAMKGNPELNKAWTDTIKSMGRSPTQFTPDDWRKVAEAGALLPF